jgi:hypothetical protein
MEGARVNRYARDLIYAAVCWRDAARRTHSATFKRLWLRNMRDCALAWREACKEEQE